MIPGAVPIGGVIAWLKSFTGVSSLATQQHGEYVECNGQTLSDANSPLNGQVIPNLNGSGGNTQRFLRGATTSGGTGGADTAQSGDSVNTSIDSADNNGVGSTLTVVTCASIVAGTFGILPSYYQVVFLVRVK